MNLPKLEWSRAHGALNGYIVYGKDRFFTKDQAAEVIRRAEAYEGLMKFLITIEWIHVAFYENDYFCPCCMRSKEDGHYKNCRLKQALGEQE